MAKDKKHHDAASHSTKHAHGDHQPAAAPKSDKGLAELHPLALTAGALVLGAVAGALLPRSPRERELLKPVGDRIGGAVTAATAAAKETGQTELERLGISRDAARAQIRTLIEGLVQAASTTGSAALHAASAGATSGTAAGTPPAA